MKVGDVVTHKNGQRMSVKSVRQRKMLDGPDSETILVCQWFDIYDQLHEAEFIVVVGLFK